MIIIDIAADDDVTDVIASASALVSTDAGRHDADATNIGWATDSGLSYATSAIRDDNSLVLIAREDGQVRGHAVGRLHGPGSVHPIRVAELESIHVYPEHRGRGIGEQLLDAFLAWASEHGADRASVTAYTANDGAQRFYTRHGFSARSVVLDRGDLRS